MMTFCAFFMMKAASSAEPSFTGRTSPAAPAPAAAVSGKAYNIGCGSRTSLLDIISRIEGMLGRSFKRKHSPSRVGDVPHTLADVSRAKRDMGYKPLVEFDEGLRRTVEFFTGRKVG